MKNFNFLSNLLQRVSAMSGMRAETINYDGQPAGNRRANMTPVLRHCKASDVRVAQEWYESGARVAQEWLQKSSARVAQGLRKSVRFAATILVLLWIGVGNVWGDTWTRVTSVAQITAGGTFIIGYENDANTGVLVPLRAEGGTATTTTAGLIYSGTTSGSSSNGSIDMSTIIATTDYEVIIVAGASSGTVSIKLSDNNFIGNDNTKNKVKLYSSVCDNTSFTPTIGTNDVVTLELENGSDSYPYLQYNKTANQERFCCYNGGQQNVVLYKKGASVKRTVTWMVDGSVYSAGSPTEEVDDGSKVTTLPTAPSVPIGCTGSVFVGWTETNISGSLNRPGDNAAISSLNLFTDAEDAPTVSGGNATYYAVFAEEEE